MAKFTTPPQWHLTWPTRAGDSDCWALILRTANNIINLPELYYYAFYMWVLWNCRAGIQTRAFVNRSYGINSNRAAELRYAGTSRGSPVKHGSLPIHRRCPILPRLLPWWSRSLSSDDVCWVRPAISIRGLIGSRTNKQYNGVGRDVLSREGAGWGDRGCGTRLPFVTWCWLLWRQMIILGSMIELMGCRNRWDRKEKWVVSDKPSLCVWL